MQETTFTRTTFVLRQYTLTKYTTPSLSTAISMYYIYYIRFLGVGSLCVAPRSPSAMWTSSSAFGKGQMGSALMGSPQISQSVKIDYFCSGPIRVDPICPQPRPARGALRGLRRGRPRQDARCPCLYIVICFSLLLFIGLL